MKTVLLAITVLSGLAIVLIFTAKAEAYVAIDLNPSGFGYSVGNGAGGTLQAGWGFGPATNEAYHALLWRGTPNSSVDLNPPGFAYSVALGAGGAQQVGYGSVFGGDTHGLLWSGT